MKIVRFLIGSTLILALLALLFGASFASPRAHFYLYSSSYSVIYRFGLGVAAILVMFLYIYYAKIRPLQASSVHSKLVPLSRGRAVSLQRRVGQTRPVTTLEAQIFALAITNPGLFRPRVIEVYEPSRRTINQEVTIDVQLPPVLFRVIPTPQYEDGNNQRPDEVMENELPFTPDEPKVIDEALEVPQTLIVPFPIVVPLKGVLNDELEIYGLNGSRLATYSYSEYLELVAGILRMLFLKACDMGESGTLHGAVSGAEISALRCIMQRGLQNPGEVTKVIERILSLTALNLSTDHASPHYPNPRMISLVAEVVRLLANRYAIVALIECNSDYRSLIRYRRTVVPGLSLSEPIHHPVKWGRERLSILLGAQPVRIRIPLATAATCRSYHLVARCPEGLYLRIQRFVGLKEYLEADASRRKARRIAHNPDVTIPPYYHVRSRLGQPYAHFYSRYFVEPTIENSTRTALSGTPMSIAGQMTDTSEVLTEFPVADFTFVEVPPGSLFRGTLAALSAFALIWIVGFIVSRGLNPGTDAPAVLLAFPAILAGWLGVDSFPRRLLEGTLTARVSLASTAVFALSASALFMIYRAHVPILHGPIPFPIRFEFLGISEGSWGVLTALAFVNAVYITYRWLKHTWEYKALCARRSPLERVIEGG